jgi:hypothetical protein
MSENLIALLYIINIFSLLLQKQLLEGFKFHFIWIYLSGVGEVFRFPPDDLPTFVSGEEVTGLSSPVAQLQRAFFKSSLCERSFSYHPTFCKLEFLLI